MPAGGALNLAAVANIARSAGGDKPVVIIADADGDPDGIRGRIAEGLASAVAAAAAPTRIFVFEPTFEEALGVLAGLAEGRRRVLRADYQLLRRMVQGASIRAAALNEPELRKLLIELGFVANS